ncbi:MAG TPA: TRAP transporter small permease [Alphaproteobacteria bacterium]|nr:TRAP transporter small permease [Alphaproteobacteria bacterium]
MMTSPLSLLYKACGVVAAGFLVMIAVLTALSIITRLLGLSIPGLTAYAGYSMAASSFLALAYTFGHGGHIRVSLLLGRLQGQARRIGELWCLAAGSFFSGYLAWHAIGMVQISHKINDISQAPDATPLWIPQIAMAFGATVLAIAMVERLIQVARGAPVDLGDPELQQD